MVSPKGLTCANMSKFKDKLATPPMFQGRNYAIVVFLISLTSVLNFRENRAVYAIQI